MSDEKTTGGRKPWAFVCHKGNRFGGAVSATYPKREVAKFLAEFIADDYEVVAVFDRPEYLALIDTLHA